MCSQKQTRDANPDDSVQHKVLIVAGALLHDYLVNEEMERAEHRWVAAQYARGAKVRGDGESLRSCLGVFRNPAFGQ